MLRARRSQIHEGQYRLLVSWLVRIIWKSAGQKAETGARAITGIAGVDYRLFVKVQGISCHFLPDAKLSLSSTVLADGLATAVQRRKPNSYLSRNRPP